MQPFSLGQPYERANGSRRSVQSVGTAAGQTHLACLTFREEKTATTTTLVMILFDQLGIVWERFGTGNRTTTSEGTRKH